MQVGIAIPQITVPPKQLTTTRYHGRLIAPNSYRSAEIAGVLMIREVQVRVMILSLYETLLYHIHARPWQPASPSVLVLLRCHFFHFFLIRIWPASELCAFLFSQHLKIVREMGKRTQVAVCCTFPPPPHSHYFPSWALSISRYPKYGAV